MLSSKSFPKNMKYWTDLTLYVSANKCYKLENLLIKNYGLALLKETVVHSKQLIWLYFIILTKALCYIKIKKNNNTICKGASLIFLNGWYQHIATRCLKMLSKWHIFPPK